MRWITIILVMQIAMFGQAPKAEQLSVPKEVERQKIPQNCPQATTDQHGRFTLKNLAPGEYKAYAWEDVESTAWMDPEFMAPLKDKGVAVTKCKARRF